MKKLSTSTKTKAPKKTKKNLLSLGPDDLKSVTGGKGVIIEYRNW